MADNASVLRRVKLSDCATFQEGYVNPPQGVPEYFGDEVKWLRAVDLNNSFVWETSRRLSRAGFESAGKASLLFEPDTLAISKSGTIGRLGILKDYMCGNRAVINIKVDRARCDNRFIFYSLQIRRNEIEELATGSVQRNLYCSVLGDLEIAIPPLAEQKAIASILGALDDKIELNRRMNATLEGMARALFQSWFVDFDPVRAKLDGRKPEGMDKATAALFPDAFQESEAGQIPKGWKVGVLDELISFVIGGDWGASEPTEDETVSCYCIRGADIPSLQGGGVGKMPTRFLKQSSVEKRQLMDGDLAIEISGGSPTQCTGRPVLISDALSKSLSLPLVASNFCRIVKLKSPVFSKFVYCWLRYLYDAGSLFQFETGTTGIKNFAFVLFCEKYPLVVPEQRIAEAFDNAVSPLFVRIQANALQSRTLANLRDTLLPKLLSGELSVAHSTIIKGDKL